MTKPGYMTAEQYLVIAAHAPLPTTVEGFSNAPVIGHVIYSAVPGQSSYSPIWHNNWVLVPPGYQAHSLRSVAAVKASGYTVVSSSFYDN